ncbi:alpha-L-rhamnosidase C-terminal domain-containing protein [Lactiplantibacillus sp. WILCCON 0030]|uniref:Alpha-L-rhamnosidase C-terminal domain-containing protein n=1 Tax=Lactiplantibacillus brownii TaxID=3069269 RepID=A0ABU1A7R8_9LACO|nr:alpha-L-rhamnosidase C-terminal domain-containing protein [Lactiplantibacillus brownii]MDQ7936705.1 alpha-L-rhamnosidase C-terminal domain-containing protein [Lactiplantibacillus brownii]
MQTKKDSGWIWTPDWTVKDQQVPKLVLFRRSMMITSSVNAAKVKVTADSRYKFYVNGRLVEVGPLKGNQKKWYFDELDISNYLHVGLNVIGVKVLRYPPVHRAGNYGVVRTKMPGLYIQGEIDTDEGTYPLVTDSGWKTFNEHRFEIVSEANDFAPLQIYEKSSGSEVSQKWLMVDADLTSWKPAKLYEQTDIPTILKVENLQQRTVPFMRRRLARFGGIKQLVQTDSSLEIWNSFLLDDQPIAIAANQRTIVEITANAEQTGYLRLSVAGGAGTRIKILQSEAYVKPETQTVNGLTIHVKGDREDEKNGYLDGFYDTYTVGGTGTSASPEVYVPFWLRTFRFIRLEIETGDQPLTLTQFNYESTGYPLTVKTEVQTSDASLHQIWQLSERTLRRCMHETYEDCPYYEQQQYLMDTRAQILYTYAISADDRLARKAIDDFKCSQNPDGTLNASSPNFEENIIPTFSVYYIWMVYDHMMYFDDHQLLKDNLETIKRILTYFEAHVTDEGYLDNLGGLNGISRYWSFIDWAAEWNQTSGVPTAVKYGPVTIESLLYLYGLQAAIKIMIHLGFDKLANKYLDQAEKLRAAIKRNCIGENGMIQDGPGLAIYSQHARVFGILTHVLSYEQGRLSLVRTIEHRQDYAQCSVAMSFYLFAALKQVGLYSESNQYWDIWRRMLAKHCTTSVEAEAGERSECHAWGALALYELPTTILGVSPATPGYRTVSIKPTPGYLKWAKGSVKTPVGVVNVDWRMKDGQMNLNYDAPVEVELEEE